jgi:P-type conjugative transfer protein TrbJ
MATMKKFIALALVTLGITVPARAQWIVCDPANTVQSVINTSQEITKFVEMINNQVQQIETLTDQLDEFKHYKELFGDPNAVVLTTVQPLVNDLHYPERRNGNAPRNAVSACRRRPENNGQLPVCFD